MRRFARGGLAVLVVAGLAVAGPSGAASAAGGQARAGLLQLAGQSGVVAPDGDLVMRVRATGAPPGAQLAVGVHNRVQTRSEFVRTLDGDDLRGRLAPNTIAPLEDLDPDPSGTVELTVATRTGSGDANRVRVPSAGVYPVVVELLDKDGDRIDSLITHLVRLPDDGAVSPPLAVALSLPLHGPPALAPDGSSELDATARDGIVTTISALLNHPRIDLTLDPTPETIAALGRDAVPGDIGVLESLRSALSGRQVMARPFVELDIAAWLDAGLGDQLAAQFDRGGAVLDERLGATDTRTWSASASVDATTARWLRDRGADQLVVPESALTPLDERQFPIALTQTFELDGVEGARAAVADAGLTTRFDTTGDPVLDAHRLLADLAVLYYDEPPSRRGVVVVPPEAWTPSAPFLDALLAGLAGAGTMLRPVDMTTFFAVVPQASMDGDTIDESDPTGPSRPLVRTLSPTPGRELGSLVPRLAEAEGAVSTYTSVIGPDSPRADPFAERVLVSGASGLGRAAQTRYLDAVRADIDEELAKIRPPGRQTITLTDRDGQVPLVFYNDTGYPVDVVARLEATKLEFPELAGGVLRLRLHDQATRVEVKVRARTSGDSPLDITLMTPDGNRELGRARFTVRSTAVSGLGLVLSIGAGTFLVMWWGRNIRRTRRDRRARRAPAAVAPPRGAGRGTVVGPVLNKPT